MQGVHLLKVTDINSHVFEPNDDSGYVFMQTSAPASTVTNTSHSFSPKLLGSGPQFATSYVRLRMKSDMRVLCGTCQRNNKGNIANVCV